MEQHLTIVWILLGILVALHLVEIALIGIVTAWAVERARTDQERMEERISREQKRMEKEWTQVLQILAHGRTAEHER